MGETTLDSVHLNEGLKMTMLNDFNYDQMRLEAGLLCFKYQKEDLLELNCAYAEMLLSQGLLTQNEYTEIKKGLLESFPKVTEKDFEMSNGDIHFTYESALFKQIGPQIAQKLHVGRSRNDMYFTLYRMSVRRALLKVSSAVLELQAVLKSAIENNVETVIPYYTYGQPSQPGTWGHYLESIRESLTLGLLQSKSAFELVNQSPMGAAAGIGTAFNLNRDQVARLLGFDQVVDNTLLAISDVVYYLQSIFAFTTINVTLTRLTNDLIFFSSTECGILDCDMSLCGGSSIMPQKKNVEALETLRTQTLQLGGYLLNSIASSSATFFSSYQTYAFFDKFWDNVDILVKNILLTALVIQKSTIKKDIAYKRTRDGFTAATGMAETLTIETKESFAVTHHVVGGMIKELMHRDNLEVGAMTPTLLEDVSQKVMGIKIVKTKEQIAELLDPLVSLNAKITGGTPKPQDTLNLLSRDEVRLTAFSQWLQETEQHLLKCREHLIGKKQ